MKRFFFQYGFGVLLKKNYYGDRRANRRGCGIMVRKNKKMDNSISEPLKKGGEVI